MKKVFGHIFALCVISVFLSGSVVAMEQPKSKVAIGLIAKNESGQDMVLLNKLNPGGYTIFGKTIKAGNDPFDTALSSLSYCTRKTYNQGNVQKVDERSVGRKTVFIVEGQHIPDVTSPTSIKGLVWVPANEMLSDPDKYPVRSHRGKQLLLDVLKNRAAEKEEDEEPEVDSDEESSGEDSGSSGAGSSSNRRTSSSRKGKEPETEDPRELHVEDRENGAGPSDPDGSLCFHGALKEELKDVFQYVPKGVKIIFSYLKRPALFPGFHRCMFFVGAPGSFKSTTARAIAYEAKEFGWKCRCYASEYFQGKYRNETKIRLMAVLKRIVKSKVKTIIIIDEINKLLEHYNSEHHDTGATSAGFWTFLDDQKGNEHFFLIGTMNRGDKLPPQIKNRLEGYYIIFPSVAKPEMRKRIFNSKLNAVSFKLHPECLEQGEGRERPASFLLRGRRSRNRSSFLDRFLQKLDGWAGRDIEQLIVIASRLSVLEDEECDEVVLKKEHLEQAFTELKRVRQHNKYSEQEETVEERQERLHKESVTLQERHHRDNASRQENHHRANRNQSAMQSVPVFGGLLSAATVMSDPSSFTTK